MINISVLGFSDPISSWTHLLTAVVALILAFPLVNKGRGSSARVFALALYSFSLVFLFSMSGTFHLLDRAGEARGVLQRLDHAGIWVLIAGTFTPMHVILFRGPWRWLILLIVWLIAINGLVLEVVFFETFPEWLALSFFLGLGWMGSLTGYKFRTSFRGESIRWLIGGGLAYSVGAVIDFSRYPIIWDGYFGPHEIFHLFVVLGAACHWIFIWDWADHPIFNSIVFEVKIYPDGRAVGEAVTDHVRVEARGVEELKKKIQIAVSEKYHSSIIPQIHLRYFQEEVLTGINSSNA